MEKSNPNFFKALISKENLGYFFLSLILGLYFFVALMDKYSISYCSIIGFSVFGLVYFSRVLLNFLNEKRHYTILNSSGFKKLIEDGFQVNKVNSYVGITGTYKGYIFDIYFDPTTYVKYGRYKGVIFNVYFEFPISMDNEDTELVITNLAKKHSLSYWWSFKPYQFYWRKRTLILKDGVGMLNPSYNKLIKRMNLTIKILTEEDLKPICQVNLEKLRLQHDFFYRPEILHYFET